MKEADLSEKKSWMIWSLLVFLNGILVLIFVNHSSNNIVYMRGWYYYLEGFEEQASPNAGHLRFDLKSLFLFITVKCLPSLFIDGSCEDS